MKFGIVEKIGSIGALVAVLSCAGPACFPICAVGGAVFGLGVLRPLEGMAGIIFRILVLMALAGNILAYLNHRRVIPLIVGVLSPALIFFTIYIFWNSTLLYVGLSGLLAASILNCIASRRCKTCQAKEQTI